MLNKEMFNINELGVIGFKNKIVFYLYFLTCVQFSYFLELLCIVVCLNGSVFSGYFYVFSIILSLKGVDWG